MRTRIGLGALAVVLAGMTLAGCGSHSSRTTATTVAPGSGTTTSTTAQGGGPGGTSTTVTTVGGGVASTTTTTAKGVTTTTKAPAGGSVQLAEAADGMAVPVLKGATITVTLSSTYWMFAPLTDTSVLQQVGTETVTPATPCVPGGGCGTASVTYRAVGDGVARVNASRTTCGEALLCTGRQGTYSMQIDVSG